MTQIKLNSSVNFAQTHYTWREFVKIIQNLSIESTKDIHVIFVGFRNMTKTWDISTQMWGVQWKPFITNWNQIGQQLYNQIKYSHSSGIYQEFT